MNIDGMNNEVVKRHMYHHNDIFNELEDDLE